MIAFIIGLVVFSVIVVSLTVHFERKRDATRAREREESLRETSASASVNSLESRGQDDESGLDDKHGQHSKQAQNEGWVPRYGWPLD